MRVISLFGISFFVFSISAHAGLFEAKDLDGIEYDYHADAVETVCWLDMKNISGSTDENLFPPGSTRQYFYYLDGKNNCDAATAQIEMKKAFSWLQRRKYELQRVHKEVHTSLMKGIDHMWDAKQTACGKTQAQEIKYALKSPKLKNFVKFFRLPLVDAYSRGGKIEIELHDATYADALVEGEDAPGSAIMEKNRMQNTEVVAAFDDRYRNQRIKVIPYLDRAGQCHVAGMGKIIEKLAPLEGKMAEAIKSEIARARSRRAELEKKAKSYEDQINTIESDGEPTGNHDAE